MIYTKILLKFLSSWTPSTIKNIAVIQLFAVIFVTLLFVITIYYKAVMTTSFISTGNAFATEHHVITRTMQLNMLNEHIQLVLHRLQWQPTINCTNIKLLICEMEPECGFGCSFHHVCHCLLMASGANRTLVLKDDGSHSSYKGTGWESIFQPITNCKYNQSILPNEPIADYTGPSITDRLVRIPRRVQLRYDKEHTFPVVPCELVSELAMLHPNPPFWFFGQIVKFLWKLNAETQKVIDEMEAKLLAYDEGPVVGIHVRRTDKVIEAKYWDLNDYMKWVNLWYEQQIENQGSLHRHRRRLFIVTDEPKVLDEAKREYNHSYQLLFSTVSVNNGTGYNIANLRGFISDLHMLVRCNFVICTFSSNVCRLIYELKQIRTANPNANEVHSLDTYPNDLIWPKDDDYAEFPWDSIKRENIQMARQLGATSDGIFNGSIFLPIHWFRNASFPIFIRFFKMI